MFAPRKTLYLVTGVLLGSLLALATAIVLEARDKSIRTVDEARKLFALLGLIPAYKSRKNCPSQWRFRAVYSEIVVRDSPRSP